MSFDLLEFDTGWAYRTPADDESSKWLGFFPTREEAQAAAIKACEELLAQAVAEALGLK